MAWYSTTRKLARCPTEDAASLDKLAQMLLVRHLQVCLSENVRGHLKQLPKDLVRETQRETRVIAVVGAGASSGVVARGPEAAEKLRLEIDPDPRSYEAELKRLSEVYSLDRTQFETKLVAMSRTHELAQTVRQRLASMYRVRHPTLLAYELLAHLVKHRYVDAIVSFNFDELLDQSLLDELGPGEFRRVVSERDAERAQFDPAQPDYIPVLVKLHGTASDPDSLRFTRDAYYTVPQPMAGFVRTLLGRDHCVLINIGFGMGSFDFNHLLDDPARLSIYNIAHDALPFNVERDINELRRGNRAAFVNIVASRWEVADPCPFTETDLLVDELVHRLEQLSKSTNGVATFRSVGRHRLVAGVLSWGRDARLADMAEYRRYLRDRTIIEIALSAIRGRGLVSISSLVADRCGTYYDLYAKTWTEREQRDEQWGVVCLRGGLQPSEISNETFVAIPKIRVRTDEGEHDLATLRIDISRLLTYIGERLTERTRAELERLDRAELEDILLQLQRETEIELHARDDRICSKVFIAPTVLSTLTSLHGATIYMLQHEEYDELAIVAETGRWLLEEPYLEILQKKPTLKIHLIVAFDTYIAELRKAFPGVQHVRAHWWRHNRHMTIVCNKDQPRAAIYFARRQRSLFVTPVYLYEESDKRALLNVFLTYWLRAALLPPALEREQLPGSFKELPHAVKRLRQRHGAALLEMAQSAVEDSGPAGPSATFSSMDDDPAVTSALRADLERSFDRITTNLERMAAAFSLLDPVVGPRE